MSQTTIKRNDTHSVFLKQASRSIVYELPVISNFSFWKKSSLNTARCASDYFGNISGKLAHQQNFSSIRNR